ncbi:hypothetical protein ANO14919_028420 [Xylariales sp. No.14919]|nr:hypothetical protein ANO14919_028420 [Xylariales sp. No.14919]
MLSFLEPALFNYADHLESGFGKAGKSPVVNIYDRMYVISIDWYS